MLTKLELNNFTVFEHAEFEFGMLNVIHGENGTGKTHLLKVIHLLAGAAAQPDVGPSHSRLMHFTPDRDKPAVKLTLVLWDRAARIFGVPNLALVVRTGHEAGTIAGVTHLGGRIGVYVGHDPEFDLLEGSELTTDWGGTATFIPATDVLSRDPALVELYADREIREDCTAADLLAEIRKPPIRHPPEWVSAILTDLERAIGGRPQVDRNGAVLIDSAGNRAFSDEAGSGAGSSDGSGFGYGSGSGAGHGDGSGHGVPRSPRPATQLVAALVAQGHLKLASLALVMTRVDLRNGWTLCWDEPEANLNPALLEVTAKAIVMLAQAGVQVFIATHSLMLIRQIYLITKLLKQPVATRWFGLQRHGAEVTVDQGDDVAASGEMAALDQELIQADLYLAVESGSRKPGTLELP